MHCLFIIFLCANLVRGFDFVLIETQLSFTFYSDLSYTIAEFLVPSQITCAHKCRNFSNKMFYDGDLCICFEKNWERIEDKKKSNNKWIRQGILMTTLKMEKIKVNIGIC